MGKFIDLTGQRFGRFTVTSRKENDSKNRIQWLCRCDCGNERIIKGCDLRSGNTRSCGCLSLDLHTLHGGSYTRLYNIWEGMKRRCQNPNSESYVWYGAKGITVCEEWQQYKPFEQWALTNGYADELSIDRIDNDKGYCPDNCRWETSTGQARNHGIRSDNNSGHKGIFWNAKSGKWLVYIGVDGKRISLGSFNDLQSAIKARQDGELQYWGGVADASI